MGEGGERGRGGKGRGVEERGEGMGGEGDVDKVHEIWEWAASERR